MPQGKEVISMSPRKIIDGLSTGQRWVFDTFVDRRRPLSLYIFNIVVLLLVLSPYNASRALTRDEDLMRYHITRIADQFVRRYISEELNLDDLLSVAEEAMGRVRQRMFANAVTAMTGLLDRHSFYIGRTNQIARRPPQLGGAVNYGVLLRQRIYYPEIVHVIPDSAAYAAGILPGDILVAFNSVCFYRRTNSFVESMIRRSQQFSPSDMNTFYILRSDEFMAFELNFTDIQDVSAFAMDLQNKSLFPGLSYIDSPLTYLAENPPLYIRLTSFNRGAALEMSQILAKYSHKTSLILDIRDNPGGSVRELREITMLLHPPGVMYYIHRRGSPSVPVVAAGNFAFERIVVLVNENTASAGEVLAGSLQASGIAAVIGSPTFGKGTAQEYIRMPSGGTLRLSTMEFRLPSGARINGYGIIPDIRTSALQRVSPAILSTRSEYIFAAGLENIRSALTALGLHVPYGRELALDMLPYRTYFGLPNHGGINAAFVERLNAAINEYNLRNDQALNEALILLLPR